MLKTIHHVLQLAKQHNGIAFGGFVRDFVICKLDWFRDMDLWFQKQSDQDDFERELQAQYKVTNNTGFNTFYFRTNIRRRMVTIPCPDIRNKPANAKGEEARLIKKHGDDGLLWIDMCLSVVFPVDDMNVNLMMFDGQTLKLGKSEYDPIKNERTQEQTIREIISREVFLFPSYLHDLFHSTEAHSMYVSFYRLKDFASHGWRLMDFSKLDDKHSVLSDIGKAKMSKIENEAKTKHLLDNGSKILQEVESTLAAEEAKLKASSEVKLQETKKRYRDLEVAEEKKLDKKLKLLQEEEIKIDDKISEIHPSWKCPVCLKNDLDIIKHVISPCGHTICVECVKLIIPNWSGQKQCPNCRSMMASTIRVYD